jgi:steroid 5-alpha reductase family enzyme
MAQTFFLAAVVVFLSLAAAFLLAIIRRDDSLTTSFYGPAIVAATAAAYFADGQFAPRQILVNFMVAFWGVRLGVHLFLKNSGRGLDWRLARWRREGSGGLFVQGFLRGFLGQGVAAMAVLTPVLLVMADPGGGLTLRDAVGTLVWLAGFFLEAVADSELLAWKKIPGNENHLVTTGLWRWSRHPNYLGEMIAWIGVFLVGLAARHGWWGAVSPLSVAVLILFVTGIPMAEKKYRNHPEWAAYAARTPALVPWFPRRGA